MYGEGEPMIFRGSWMLAHGRQGRSKLAARHVIIASSFLLDTMAKHLKLKKISTLTKIDLTILVLKPQVILQHIASDGKIITNIAKPVYDSPVELDIFNANPSNFKDDYLEDNATEEEATRGYYIAQVCPFVFFSTYEGPLSLGQLTATVEGGMADVPR